LATGTFLCAPAGCERGERQQNENNGHLLDGNAADAFAFFARRLKYEPARRATCQNHPEQRTGNRQPRMKSDRRQEKNG